MRLAFPAWQAALLRPAIVVAVAVSMVACDSSTGPTFPSQITSTAGDGQTVAVSTAATTPLTVVVKDVFGNVVPNAIITWSVTSGSGTLKSASTTTGNNGQATNVFTAGTTTGDAVVDAVLAGATNQVTFTEHVGS